MAERVKKKDEEIKEQLLVESLGYVKIPKRVRDQYGNPKQYPNPDVSAQEVSGQLVIEYRFDLDKLPKKKEVEQMVEKLLGYRQCFECKGKGCVHCGGKGTIEVHGEK